jgi:hypothetical protein
MKAKPDRDRASTWTFTACVLAASLASGCGKGSAAADGGGAVDGGPGPDGGAVTGQPIPLDQLCAAYTTALCTYFTQCGDFDFKDINHCIAETDCLGVATLATEVAAGAIGYDPAGAGTCEARFLADPCHFGTFLFTPTIFEVLAQCPGTLAPKRGAGEPCADTRECPSGHYCQKSGGGRTCPGVCTAYGKVGDACSTSAACAPGMVCRDGTCHLYAKAGDACAAPADCGPTLICLDDPTCTTDNLWCDVAGTRTCQKGVGLGATCGTVTSNGATTTINCESGLWCDAFLNQSGTCRVPGGAGAPCSFGYCMPGLHCEGDVGVGPMATLGTCVAPAPVGGACKFTSECASDLACFDSMCAARAGLNESCSGDADCQSGLFCASSSYVCLTARYPGESCADAGSGCVHSLCRAGTCVDHAKAGQPCATGDDCVSGDCRNGICKDWQVCSN